MTRRSRRKFLTAVPAAVAGAVAARAYAQGQGQLPSGPVKAGTVEAAEAITGVDFHAEDQTAIANGLNQRLRTIQQLRQSSVPPDTEPAIIFKPAGKARRGSSVRRR